MSVRYSAANFLADVSQLFRLSWEPTYGYKHFLYNFFGVFVIFSSVAPHRGQLAAKCNPRWLPTRRLAVSCGLGRCRIRTRDCRTTVWCATIEPPHLPIEPPHLWWLNGYKHKYRVAAQQNSKFLAIRCCYFAFSVRDLFHYRNGGPLNWKIAKPLTEIALALADFEYQISFRNISGNQARSHSLQTILHFFHLSDK